MFCPVGSFKKKAMEAGSKKYLYPKYPSGANPKNTAVNLDSAVKVFNFA